MDGFSFKDRILRLTWRFRQMGKVNYLSSFSSPNVFWIETGTYLGEGIEEALLNGFKNIISYEVYGPIYMDAVKKFQNYDNVRILFKSSVEMFDEISEINEPITFWLDGHYSSGYTSYDPNNYYPLLKELEEIEKHHIKTHTLLIDDISLYFDRNHLIKSILEINPNYIIGYEPTWRGTEEILVAKIKN